MKKKISFICIFIVTIIMILQQVSFAAIAEDAPYIFMDWDTTYASQTKIVGEGTSNEYYTREGKDGVSYKYYPATRELYGTFKLDYAGTIEVKYYLVNGNKWQVVSPSGYINITKNTFEEGWDWAKVGEVKGNIKVASGWTLEEQLVKGGAAFMNEVTVQNYQHQHASTTITANNSGEAEYQKVDPVSLDEIVSNANSFVNSGTTQISDENMQAMSNTIYNVLFVIGIALTLLIGAVLGVKFITSSLEEKADIKQAFVPYVIGVVVLFGAFTIWKIVLVVLQG